MARLHPLAQAWSEVRMAPEVLAYVALQPGALVTLRQWHQSYLTLSSPLVPSQNLVVVWSTVSRLTRRSRNQKGPGFAGAVSR